MYHCHLRLYCVGRRLELFAPLKETAPQEPFTHTFLESGEPDPALAALADVIFEIGRASCRERVSLR